jgi:hypothetical protein
MGELVASISHELAQPLKVTPANAKASLRWLQREPPDLTEVAKGTNRRSGHPCLGDYQPSALVVQEDPCRTGVGRDK